MSQKGSISEKSGAELWKQVTKAMRDQKHLENHSETNEKEESCIQNGYIKFTNKEKP